MRVAVVRRSEEGVLAALLYAGPDLHFPLSNQQISSLFPICVIDFWQQGTFSLGRSETNG